MHHPLTREKNYLTGLAALISDCKYQLSNDMMVDGPEMSRKQCELSRLKRAYRHRHIAYCLVRQNFMSTDGVDVNGGPIEAQYSASKPNMKIVNMHRMRLLTSIGRAYSDEVDRLIEKQHEIQEFIKERHIPSFITESAAISKKVWDTISAPICLVENDDGTSEELAISDFERNTKTGEFQYTVKKQGIVHLQNGYPREVNPEDTLNFSDDSVNITLPIAELPIADLKETYAINQRDDDYKTVIERLNHYLAIAADFKWSKPLLIEHVWDYLPINDEITKGTDNIYDIHGLRYHKSVDIEYVRDHLEVALSRSSIPAFDPESIGEAWQSFLELESEQFENDPEPDCPNFLGCQGDSLTTDECSLGGLCTEKFPLCRHYDEAQMWNDNRSSNTDGQKQY